ncbi:MlaD family protein [Gordonia iterans]
MSDFRTPGMAAGWTVYTRRALVFLASSAVALIGFFGVARLLPESGYRVTMQTNFVAGGIVAGSPVVLNGADVGTVGEVDVIGPDQYSVVLVLNSERIRAAEGVFTDSAYVGYAPENVFGISAVVMRSQDGGTPLRNGSTFRVEDPEDATLTTLLRNLSDLQNEAFDPHVSDLLNVADRATRGLLPIFGAAGQIASDVAETQVVSPRETLPLFTELLTAVGGAVDDLLPPIRKIMEWDAPQQPGYLQRSEEGLSFTATTIIEDARELLGPSGLEQTAPLMPVLTALIDRVTDTFPDSRRNGIQIATLIERLDKAFVDTPAGPVLTVDVVIRSAPGLAAALGLPGRNDARTTPRGGPR